MSFFVLNVLRAYNNRSPSSPKTSIAPSIHPGSPCGPLSGPKDLAWAQLDLLVSHSGQGKSGGDCKELPGCAAEGRQLSSITPTPQSGAEVLLPCPDWPYLPSLTLWSTFRGHRPRLHIPSAAPSHPFSAGSVRFILSY